MALSHTVSPLGLVPVGGGGGGMILTLSGVTMDTGDAMYVGMMQHLFVMAHLELSSLHSDWTTNEIETAHIARDLPVTHWWNTVRCPDT